MQPQRSRRRALTTESDSPGNISDSSRTPAGSYEMSSSKFPASGKDDSREDSVRTPVAGWALRPAERCKSAAKRKKSWRHTNGGGTGAALLLQPHRAVPQLPPAVRRQPPLLDLPADNHNAMNELRVRLKASAPPAAAPRSSCAEAGP